MPNQSRSLGLCGFCHQCVERQSMGAHMHRCPALPTGRSTKFHLVFQGKERPDYWLHLFASPSTTLSRVDAILRSTWLECCGHLSAFDLGDGGGRYESTTAFYDGWGPRPRSMNAKLVNILSVGAQFDYEYDFGSTTYLAGSVLEPVLHTKAHPAIQVVARNLLPGLPCEKCSRPALWADAFAHDVNYCDDCIQGRVEGLLPIVNSPRMGVCGYAREEHVVS